MKRYPAEQIYYEMDVQTCLGNEECSKMVAEALSKVPKRVVDKVLKNCAIAMPNADGAYFNHLLCFTGSRTASFGGKCYNPLGEAIITKQGVTHGQASE